MESVSGEVGTQAMLFKRLVDPIGVLQVSFVSA